MMTQQVSWNIPKTTWTEMQKALADARSVEGLGFDSMEQFGLVLLTLGLKLAQKDMEKNKVIEEPRVILAAEGPWMRNISPNTDSPYLRDPSSPVQTP